GGSSLASQRVLSTKTTPFDAPTPAESVGRALAYPACDADRSTGAHRGRLYCSWMDAGERGTDIFLATSDDGGSTWSASRPVGDRLSTPVDRFNHWLAVDAGTGDVVGSVYDTRNDTNGHRFETDDYPPPATRAAA